jgi:enoyl-CoA hydratase/carnithine racemase
VGSVAGAAYAGYILLSGGDATKVGEATTVAELAELVGLIEEDADLNVVVFDSANFDFYLAHYDVDPETARTAALLAGPTGMHIWLNVLVRLSRAPVVSIAAIRGCAHGAGGEFVLACDLRFASRETRC